MAPDRNSDVDNPERLEAEARVVMWELSKIRPPDQYDPLVPREDRRRARQRLLAEWDALVDRWATSRLLESIARISEEAP